MPLKLIVLSPTSRMKAAFWREEVGLKEARLWRRVREAGELTVMVAAVCEMLAAIDAGEAGRRTVRASHGRTPRELEIASRCMSE